MREAIGGTWLMQLIIIFMLVFVGFLALALNFTKALQIRNDIISMIEHKEGFTTGNDGAVTLINNYLQVKNYTAKNGCPVDSYGVSDLNSGALSLVTNTRQKYYYCVTKVATPSNLYTGRSHYEVRVFFHFNLPILGDLFTFTAKGNSYEVIYPLDHLKKVES